MLFYLQFFLTPFLFLLNHMLLEGRDWILLVFGHDLWTNFSLAYDLSPNRSWQTHAWFTVNGDKKHQSSIKMILERYLISLKSMELCIKLSPKNQLFQKLKIITKSLIHRVISYIIHHKNVRSSFILHYCISWWWSIWTSKACLNLNMDNKAHSVRKCLKYEIELGELLQRIQLGDLWVSTVCNSFHST